MTTRMPSIFQNIFSVIIEVMRSFGSFFICSHAEITGGGAEFNIPFVNRVAPPIAESDGFMYTFYCDLEKVMMIT